MNTTHPRRDFLHRLLLGLAGASAAPLLERPGRAAPAGASQAADLIDTHVHFYDPQRPGGVPWPPKDDAVLYRTVRPAHYAALAQPRPVTGVVVVEASPLVEDNQWVLDLAEREPLIVGLVGNLSVGQDGFREHLKRFAAHRLFRGVRIRPAPARRLWDAPQFLSDLKALADAGLALDLVGGTEVLELAQGLARGVPALRIVIDHLAGARIDGKEPAQAWLEGIRAAAQFKNVSMKISGLVEGTGQRGGKAPRETEYYKPTLDAVWTAFGEDRLIYGSNWPVCEHFADLATVQRLATEYIAAKGEKARAKVFSRNAQAAYQWVRRDKAGH